jgi:hypothetical protein
MDMETADRELVGSYARDGSENAFRTLVARHVDLVFGAALRQTGDPGMAEEITQNVFVALLVATPLGWRWAQNRTLEASEQSLVQRKSELEAQLGDATAITRQIRARLVQAGADAFNLRTRLAVAASTEPGSENRYRWDDSAALARIPKEVLQHFWVPAVADRDGTLTLEIQALLQMAPAESAAVQGALHQFSRAAESAQAARTRPVSPSAEELEGRPPSEVPVFEIRDFGPSFTSLTQNLTHEIAQALGPERSGLLRGPLSDWIPIGDIAHRLSSSWAFMSGDHRIRFLNEVSEADGELWIPCRIHKDSGSVLYPMAGKIFRRISVPNCRTGSRTVLPA